MPLFPSVMNQVASLDHVQTLLGHDDRVWFVSWSPTGTFKVLLLIRVHELIGPYSNYLLGDLLASCSGDRTVRLWAQDTSSMAFQCVAVLEDMHSRTIRSCSWSPDGRSLATASFDRTVAIWKRRGGSANVAECQWENVAILEGHENEVKRVAWNPNGCLLATCGRDKTLWIWESIPGNEYEVVDVKHGHSQDVKTVAWHPAGELLVSASYDDSLKVWRESEDEWMCAQTLEGPALGHTSTVWDVAFDAKGDHMVSVSDDCTFKIWSCSKSGQDPKFKLVATASGYHDRTIYSVDWSHSSKVGYIATASADDSIGIFTLERTEGVRELFSAKDDGCVKLVVRKEKAHTSDVNCVAWHPTKVGLLASASDDGCIVLWELKLGST